MQATVWALGLCNSFWEGKFIQLLCFPCIHYSSSLSRRQINKNYIGSNCKVPNMLKAHQWKRNTIYLLGYVKIRVYSIVHNLVPVLYVGKEKKPKKTKNKRDAHENKFWPNPIFCFPFLLQKACLELFLPSTFWKLTFVRLQWLFLN